MLTPPRRARPAGMEKHMTTIRSTAALTVALMIASLGAAQTGNSINPTVLTVNGEPVYAADISLVLQSMPRQQPGGEQADQAKLVNMATQRVVEQKLLAQEARRLKLEPKEDRVQKAFDMIVQQSGGRETLSTNLDGAGTSIDKLLENLREIDLVKVYIDTQIRPGIEVGDDEVEKYYREHPELFAVAEQVRARHIVFMVAENADSATVEAARTRAEAARRRALAGEDFAALATELSEGPNASNGGDLGTFTADLMVEPISDAAFALEPGGISEVVRTRFGFHVVKLEERLPAGTTSLEEARPQLRKAIGAQKAGQAMTELMGRLSAEAKIVQVVEPASGGPAAPGRVP